MSAYNGVFRMMRPQLAIVCVLILAVVATSGCLEGFFKTTKYTYDEDLTIVIKTNYKGNYTILIPYISDPDAKEDRKVYSDLIVHFETPQSGDGESVKVNHIAGQATTDHGKMLYVTTHNNVTLKKFMRRASTSVSVSEQYLKYEWSPPVDAMNSTTFSKAQSTPLAKDTFIHFDLNWTAKSTYCSRHNTISGDLKLDNNWTLVSGYFPPGKCT
jgi:hypothetical protein